MNAVRPSPPRVAMGLALAALLIVAAGACAPPPGPPAPTTGPSGPVPFVVVASGQVARYDQPAPALFVLGDAAAFQTWWAATVGQGDPSQMAQAVNFGQDVAIAVFLGRRTTGGYGIAVRELQQQGGILRVIVETRMPSPGGLVPQVITSPYQIIKVSTSALPGWQQLHYIMQATDGTTLAETDP